MQDLSIRERMQETLHQTADAGDYLSGSGWRRLFICSKCRRLSIRQQIQDNLSDIGYKSISIRQWMLEYPHQTADAGVFPSDSGCRRLSIRQRMQEFLHQTADAGDFLSESRCRSLSIRKQMQETFYQTADAGVSLSDSECRRLSIRQWMQETLYQTADAGDTIRQRYRSLSIRQRM